MCKGLAARQAPTWLWRRGPSHSSGLRSAEGEGDSGGPTRSGEHGHTGLVRAQNQGQNSALQTRPLRVCVALCLP